MLVLSRRAEEAIVIGENITITVLGVDRNGVVRLGIDAPKTVRIVRKELIEEVREVNRKALAAADAAVMLDGLDQWIHPSSANTDSGGTQS